MGMWPRRHQIRSTRQDALAPGPLPGAPGEPRRRRFVVKDANGNVTTNLYFSNSNRLQAVQNALGDRTTFGYNLAGEQTEIQDSRGNRTSFTYDNAGRLKTQKNALSEVTSWLYDTAGRNTTVIDALGNVKTLTYDAVANLVSVLYADSTRVTFAYESAGRRTTMQDWGGTTTWVYNGRGEVTGQTQPGGYVLAMVYDSVGNREVLIDPDGGRFTSTYDALNRASSIKDPDGNLTTFQYDSASQRTTLTDANGNTRQYAYDGAGRLTTQIELNASAVPILTIVDSYDNVGNRTGRNQDGAITTWVYDTTNRLVSQILSGARASFTYDSVGNILVKHQESSNPIRMVYDAANRIETSQQGAVVTTYTSDASGNLTAQNAGGSRTTFTYDNENRLKTIQDADATLSSYTYAGGFPVQGEGLRRSHHAPGGSLTTTIWDASDYLMEKGGGATVRYVVSEGEMLAEKRSGLRLAFVPDPLGSVIGLLNSSQVFTDTFAFWPSGEVRARTGSTPTPFQWVGTLGYYRELEWLYYVRARYELAVLGRWLTEDPCLDWKLVTSGDWTQTAAGVAYGAENPLSRVDPTGLWCIHISRGFCIGPGCAADPFCSSFPTPSPSRNPPPPPPPWCNPPRTGHQCGYSFVCKSPPWWKRGIAGHHYAWCKSCELQCSANCLPCVDDANYELDCLSVCIGRGAKCQARKTYVF